MLFVRRMFPLVIVAAALLPLIRSTPAVADEKPTAAASGKEPRRAKQAPKDQSAEERPDCMHCGATCGLVAVCVCKPGTRKIPKTEYEAKSDPICVPCCGGPPWKPHRRDAGCTTCEVECQDAWVRQRKKLVKETKDDEQPTIERQIAWVCRGCVRGASVSCTGGGDAAPRRASWWPAWLPHP